MSERSLLGLGRTLGLFARTDPILGAGAALLEPVGIVAGFDDMAMMGQPIQKRRGEFGITEYAAPFGEGQVGRDDDARSLIEPREQVKQQCSARLRERQIPEFIENHQILLHQAHRELARRPRGFLPLQRVDQVPKCSSATAGLQHRFEVWQPPAEHRR